MPRSDLNEDETQTLIDEATQSYPDSDFIPSVEEWFHDMGFITEAQEEALSKIIEQG